MSLATARTTSDEEQQQRLRAALTVLVRAYAAERRAGREFAPIRADEMSATEALVFTSDLLRAMNLEVFELTMWMTLGVVEE
ncbi:MAG TPA: hypothetical protein VND96_15265 [Candidatus Micrarchaeaceae archaeon]|nr:hypothetical protein [Candidatus Micrarchaeaceae archaeon]